MLNDAQKEFAQTQLCRNVWNVLDQEYTWKPDQES